MASKIEWTEETWNSVTGCSKCSPGCQHCYAEAMAKRFWGNRKFTDIQCHEDRLDKPRHWRKPRRIFVCSMSDLFHPNVPFWFIDKVHGTIFSNPFHTYQILTKRIRTAARYYRGNPTRRLTQCSYIHLGVSISTANEMWKVAELARIPAAVRWISFEPLLEDVGVIPLKGIHWVVVGGESGPKARPMHPNWPRNIRDQCVAAGVPFFFKQWGEWAPFEDCIDNYGSTWGCTAYNRALKRCAKAHGATILLDDRSEGWDDIMLKNGCAVNDGLMIGRVGKKKAGHLLDGKEWRQYPK